MGARQRFEIPQGWVARGFRLEVAATTAEQRELIRQQFGARRFAYNWALAQVKADLDARAVDPSVPALGWSLPALRKAWNQAKQRVAPWVADVFQGGLLVGDRRPGRGPAPLVGQQGRPAEGSAGRVPPLQGAPSGSRPGPLHHRGDAPGGRPAPPHPAGDRAAPVQGEHPAAGAPGRQGPRAGPVDDAVGAGRAAGCVDRHHRLPRPRTPAEPDARCGLDLGIGQEWAVIAHDDTIQRIAHPAPWVQTHSERRRVARQRSRRIVGSRGHRQASAKLAALDVAAMGRGMGRRAFRRSVAQAGIGRVRPTLVYKTAQQGGRLVVADRWFASSKTHHGCDGYLADLRLSQRVWACPACGAIVDRNANAARNLRDWTGPVAVAVTGDRDVQRGGVAAPVPCVGDHGGQAHVVRGRARLQKTTSGGGGR